MTAIITFIAELSAVNKSLELDALAKNFAKPEFWSGANAPAAKSIENDLPALAALNPKEKRLVLESVCWDLDTFITEDDVKVPSVDEQAVSVAKSLNHWLKPASLHELKTEAAKPVKFM